MQPAHFRFAKLIVQDLDKTVAFYEAVCGKGQDVRVAPAAGNPAVDEVVFPAGGDERASLIFWKWRERPLPVTDEIILGLQTHDLVGFLDRVTAAGGQVVQPIIEMPEHGKKVAVVSDIDDHLIEVVELLAASS